MAMQLDWKIDIGHVITFSVLVIGFAVQYGSLSTRLSAVEVQAAKATETNQTLNITLMSLQTTIVRVQTQMDEREKRFDASVTSETFREDQRELRHK
jgi:uncharacterized coiled-coil protein SlyX